MRRKAHFGVTDAQKLQVALQRSTDAELVFLKAFASIEHLVTCLLAARLSSTPEMLPNLSFFSSASLALAGLSEKPFDALLKRAAEIRNQIAHEVAPRAVDEFASFVSAAREWVQDNPHDCAYDLSQAPRTSDPAFDLKGVLLQIVGHLCHLVAVVSEREQSRARESRRPPNNKLQRTRHGS
jgi:hypothetical protein